MGDGVVANLSPVPSVVGARGYFAVVKYSAKYIPPAREHIFYVLVEDGRAEVHVGEIDVLIRVSRSKVWL